jgi:hypothetical protein
MGRKDRTKENKRKMREIKEEKEVKTHNVLVGAVVGLLSVLDDAVRLEAVNFAKLLGLDAAAGLQVVVGRAGDGGDLNIAVL